MSKINIQANATCSWYKKQPNFKNPKLILLRSFPFGAAIGTILSALLIKLVINPAADIRPYMVIAGLAVLLSLFAHLRMLYAGEEATMILTNIHDFTIDLNGKQIYMCGETGDTPFFNKYGFLKCVTDRKECTVTFGGLANADLIYVLEKEYFGNGNRKKKYVDFYLTLTVTQAELELINKRLGRNTEQ